MLNNDDDLIFGFSPEELGFDPITRDFVDCDRTVERSDANDIIKVSIHPNLIGKYSEVWLKDGDFWGIPSDQPNSFPRIIPRKEWLTEQEWLNYQWSAQYEWCKDD